MKEYKVVDLSYSQDPRQHLKDVRAYHELDGWHLLTVVHLEASGRWLYYLEREAEPAPCGVVATPVGGEQSLPAPVRRVEGDSSGEVVTAGADVTAEGVTVEVPGRPPLTLDEFRRLRWEQSERGIVTSDPAHVPVIEKFLAAKDDPERLRAFIEDDLGGEWQEEPYAAREAEGAGGVMPESKTKLLHTSPGEPPFECSTGDMTGDGLEIVVDKRTHELLIPKERETEEAVTVIVRPRGAPEAAEAADGAGPTSAAERRARRDIAATPGGVAPPPPA